MAIDKDELLKLLQDNLNINISTVNCSDEHQKKIAVDVTITYCGEVIAESGDSVSIE